MKGNAKRKVSIIIQLQDNDVSELQKKAMFCFRIMSRCFTDPAKAEENFLILDQLKDANVWKIMATLLDPNTNSLQACRSRVRKQAYVELILSCPLLIVET